MHHWLNKRSKINLLMVTEPAKLSRKSPIYLSSHAVTAFGLRLIQRFVGATE